MSSHPSVVLSSTAELERALHHAVRKDSIPEIDSIAEIDRLLAEGVNANAKDNYGRTALHWAALNGQTETVEHLIRHGANINAKDNNGETALHYASVCGHTETVEHLIQHGADINAKDNEGKTALHWTAQHGHTETVDHLIQHSADINAKDNNGATALHWAALNGQIATVGHLIQHGADSNAKSKGGKTALLCATEHGHTAMLDYLVTAHGLDINAKNNNGATALHHATFNGHIAMLDHLVTTYDLDVNAKNDDGATALHHAAFKGHTAMLNYLVEKYELDVHATTKDGKIPLHYAAQQGHTETVDYLVQHGADVNTKDNNGKTALHSAALRGHTKTVEQLIQRGGDINAKDNNGATALYHAALNSHTETIDLLIKKYGLDINAKDDDGATILHYAVQHDHAKTIDLLVTTYVLDIHAKTIGGKTALHCAAQQDDTETIDLLLTKYALDVNAKTNNGRTALHWAALNDHTKTIAQLIQHGADINAKTNSGRTPLHCAAQYGHLATLDSLIQHGADLDTKTNNGRTIINIVAASRNISDERKREVTQYLSQKLEKYHEEKRKALVERNTVRRKLPTLKKHSSLPLSNPSFLAPQEKQNTWKLPVFSKTNSSSDSSSELEPSFDSECDERELQSSVLNDEDKIEPEYTSALIELNDFQQTIDEFLPFALEKDKWIDFLISMSTHPQALSLRAWERLEPLYNSVFFSDDALDIPWWMAIYSARIILSKNPALNPALKQWAHKLFLSMQENSRPLNPDGEIPDPYQEIYSKLIKFLSHELYPVLNRLPDKIRLQTECVECIALLTRYLEPNNIQEALLCQAVAVSFYPEAAQKSQKIAALCILANEVLDKEMLYWQQHIAIDKVQQYTDAQIQNFYTAIENADPKGVLQSLTNLIHFLLQQQHYHPQSISVSTQIATLFHSAWLVQEYYADVDPTQDTIWQHFRLVWLRIANLNKDAKAAIVTLNLLTQILEWVSYTLYYNKEIRIEQSQRYRVRLSGLLQNQFLVQDKTLFLSYSHEEDKPAIEARLQSYWPGRINYRAQLHENIHKAAPEVGMAFVERISSDAHIDLCFPWKYADLEQILPQLKENLAENRKAFGMGDKQEAHTGLLTQSIAATYSTIKERGLRQLYDGLEALWYAALKRMGMAAPCAYALVLLGSHARGDATLYSDLEFLLIVDPASSIHSEDIIAYFGQCFKVFSLHIALLGEIGSPALGEIPYRLGIHLDDKLIPFKSNAYFFGTASVLADYFALKSNSAVLEWPSYLDTIREAEAKPGEMTLIMANTAGYDARFFCGDKSLYEAYLIERNNVLADPKGIGGYTGYAALALSLCTDGVLNDNYFKNDILLQRVQAKINLLSVVSGLIKTLSAYHGLTDFENLTLMDTQKRCKTLASKGIISWELMCCLEEAYLFCDRFRTFSYVIYDRAFDHWMLFGIIRDKNKDAKCLWQYNSDLWKEVIVILHDVIYPLHRALFHWVALAQQDFEAERRFRVEPGVLTRCQETLLQEGRNIPIRFAEVVYEILMEEKQKQGQGAFLPRLTPKWWQFLLVALIHLSTTERQNLWQKLISRLSTLERTLFFETWDSLMTEPHALQQQHAYLTTTERKVLCTEITPQLNQCAASIYFPDGWTAAAYCKQRQWQKAVAGLFSRSISEGGELEEVVIQKKATVVGCVDPGLSPQTLSARVQKGQPISGLFVLKEEIHKALTAAEKEAFKEANISTDGKRHVILFFKQTQQGKTYHFFLKLFPENPGIDHTIKELQDSLGGAGELPDVYLWRLYTPFYPNGIAALLMEDIRGLQHNPKDEKWILNLSEARLQNKSAWFVIAMDSFLRHFIRVILTTPEDDKFNDYFIIPGHLVHESLLGSYLLCRVDNERSLYVSEIFEHKKNFMGDISPDNLNTTLKIKTILYCMEQMGRPIESSVVLKRLMQMDTRAFFERWLENILIWNVGAREVFKARGIMASASLSSSSLSSSMAEADDFSLALSHCERNIYTHGVFHEAQNPLYEKEAANLCLVVMPVPIDKFIQVPLLLEKLRTIIKEGDAKEGSLTALKILEKMHPTHYKRYHESLPPSLRIGALAANDPLLPEIIYERFAAITQDAYKPSGESLAAYKSMVTSGMGELMQIKDYELILRTEVAAAPREADTAEWLIDSLMQYDSKQKWDSETQMLEQMLLDRFQKLLALPIAEITTKFPFFKPSLDSRRLDQIITEFKNLSLNNKIQFCRHFLGGKSLSGWQIEKVHADVKQYLLALFLREQETFSPYRLRCLDTEAFQEILDKKTLMKLLQSYGEHLEKAIIVASFNPYTVPGFKEQLESCRQLTYLEIRVVVDSNFGTSNRYKAMTLHCSFPQLNSLTLSGITTANQLILETPNLERLTLRSLIHVDSGTITAQNLKFIALYGCSKIDNEILKKMILNQLAGTHKMPAIEFGNMAKMNGIFFYTLINTEIARYGSDVETKIAFASQFRVGQWRALELIFAKKGGSQEKEYTLPISEVLDKEESLKLLYTHPDFCKAFAKALMSAINILVAFYPNIQRLNIQVEGEAKEKFSEELKVVPDEPLKLAITYNRASFDEQKGAFSPSFS